MTQTTSAATGAGEIETLADLRRMRSVMEQLRSELHLLMIDRNPWSSEEVNKRFHKLRELRDLTQLALDMTSEYAAALSEKPAAEKEVG